VKVLIVYYSLYGHVARMAQAIAEGAFGVPTLMVAGELFWGSDSVKMMLDFLHDRELFQRPAMRRLNNLPIAAGRKSSRP